MFGSADEGGEEAFGQVFAGVACADGAAAVVDYDGRVVEVGHGWGLRGAMVWREGGRGLRRDRGKSAGARGREGVRFRGEVLGWTWLALLMIDAGQVNSCQDILEWEVFTIYMHVIRR